MTSANGTSDDDNQGWRFFGDAEIQRLTEWVAQRRMCLPQSMNAENYFVFGECENEGRLLLFRTHRPSLDTFLIYQLVRKTLNPLAKTFEEFVQKFESRPT